MSKIIVDAIQKTSGTALTWPSADGSADQSLTTDGSGTLSFATVGGKINQILQYVESGTQTTTSTSWTALTDMTLAITPIATTSKIMVMFNGTFGMVSNYTYFLRLVRLISGGSSQYPYIGDAGTPPNRATVGDFFDDASGRNFNGRSFQYLDSPATTSSITYSIDWLTEGSTAYMGRSGADGNNNYHARTPAALQLWEVVA